MGNFPAGVGYTTLIVNAIMFFDNEMSVLEVLKHCLNCKSGSGSKIFKALLARNTHARPTSVVCSVVTD